MNRWRTRTDMSVNEGWNEIGWCAETLSMLSAHTSEFLVHAADVEGLSNGIDEALVESNWIDWIILHSNYGCADLGKWCGKVSTTYAGGARTIHDLELVDRLSRGFYCTGDTEWIICAGSVDLTIGRFIWSAGRGNLILSALDIFGGVGVSLVDCVEFNRLQSARWLFSIFCWLRKRFSAAFIE